MEGEFRFFNTTQNKEFTQYVTTCTWAGSMEEAGRSITFSIAYTTAAKDKAFVNFKIELGEEIQLKYYDKEKNEFLIFSGIVFLKNRNSESYTMEFKAYDRLIYLAKSEVQMKFSQVPVADVVKNVCAALGVTVGKLHEDLNVICDFIADGMTGTEAIQRGLETCRAWYGYRYKMVMLDDNGTQKLNVVRADGQDAVEGFKITDITNLTNAQHGTSIEDMVNQVAIVNDNGTITGYVKLEKEIKKYGLLQKVYKYNSKQNTENAAKLLLQKEKEHSSLTANGNIQCISGFVVEIEEEQIKGKFMIMSDSHRIEKNNHTMDLTLDYIVEKDSREGATTEGDTNPAPTKQTGKGKKEVKAGLKEAKEAWVGAETPYGSNGCVYAATGVASYYSPWAANEYNSGVVDVPTLVSNAKANGMYEAYGGGNARPGDILVYNGNEHVVVFEGGGKYIGNSSSQGKVVEGKDFTQMGGAYVTGVIHTSAQ